MYGTGVENSLIPEYAGPAAYVSTVAGVTVGGAQAGNAGSTSSYGTGGLVGTTSALSTSTKLLTPLTDPRTVDQQMGLPFLDSNPGAPATLYLDFDGNFDADWWQFTGNGQQNHFLNITTPVFDTDGNTANFSSSEQALIKQIWSRVSEDYAPFNINVSTDYYGDFQNGKALHVVIGGNNTDWLHQDASGISSIGSFSDTAPNEVFVFNLMTWASAGVKNGDGVVINGPAAIATTISHEAGHSFSLRHHALYASDGTTITNYDPGTSTWTPIMGDNLASDRTTWYAGPNDQGANTWQDDMAIIAGATNGFGYRADDHADTTNLADSLTTKYVVGSLTGKGIINTPTDVDVFKFTTQGGTLQVCVSANTFGPNLTPVAELWSSTGLVYKANAGSSTQSIVNATVPAGTYYVLAKSPTSLIWVSDPYGKTGHYVLVSEYGNVGQYTVTVSFGQPLTSLALTTSTGSTTQTTTSLVSSPATIDAATATTVSTSLGAGQGTAPVDVGSENNSAVPALPSNLKGSNRKTIAELHDLVFQLGELDDELGILPHSGQGRVRNPRA